MVIKKKKKEFTEAAGLFVLVNFWAIKMKAFVFY